MKNPIAKYLMCAFAYYQLDTNLIPDSEFDQLAKDILANYDNIEHMHKYLVTKKDNFIPVSGVDNYSELNLEEMALYEMKGNNCSIGADDLSFHVEDQVLNI